jgi:hypothetical protein
VRPHEVHALARQAGLDHESAVVATAVAWPESGLNPAKEGDLTRVGEPTADGRRWGPSIGLWMVRSILEDRGTGSARDPEALHDPVHNARAMAEISHTGADFTPWTDFRNGAYVHYLARVREAVSMETWHPRAIRAEADPTHSGLSMLDVPPKIVLHTTEIGGSYTYNSASYFGNPYWPHATIDAAGIHQHLPIDAGAYALYRGGVDTNRANAIQCEIMAYAASIEDLDDATLAHVADWITWVAEQTGASLQVCPQGFHGQGEGMVLASENSPIRFTDDEWLAFSGICFGAGTLVTTDQGQQPIEDVRPGTLVLTHQGRWRPVTALHEREAETVTLLGHGHPGLVTTTEHPFLSTTSQLVRRNDTPTRWRALVFADPSWVPAGRLPGRYWATPAVFPLAEVPVVDTPKGKGRRISVTVTPDLLRLVGRWVADGHLGDQGRITITAHINEASDVLGLVRAAGFTPHAQRTGACCEQITFSSVALKAWLVTHFGQHAHAKRLPSWLLGCDIKHREMFLAGYLDGDGHWETEQKFDAKTVSKTLAIGLRLLATSLGYAVSLYLRPGGPQVFPGGRVCETRPQWRLKGDAGRGRGHATAMVGGHQYSRVKSVEPGGTAPVFNLAVAEDESYVADGFVVHNCGHQHIPSGNDHWDPGRFPVARCLGAPTEEDDMFTDDDRKLLEKLGALVNDVHAYQAEEKGGVVDTIEEAIAGVVNQIKAEVDGLKAGGGTVDVDALAKAVADKLAERLKA